MHQGIHREDIKAMVKKRGFTMKKVSLDHGLPGTSLTASLYKPAPTANRILAHFLGLSVHELWPQWYDRNGKRIFRSRKQSSAKIRSRHCQKLRG